jgi:AmiR/NasT family two-component response regulator
VTETPTDAERVVVLEAEKLLSDERIAELVQEIEGLKKAREHAADIEQAKGVLMHSMGIGPDAAFAVLVAASQREQVKLRELAARIAAGQDRQPVREA